MFEDPDRGALTTTITTTMMTGTGSITDLEGAFTNADPEAVLDFLAIRSHRLQVGEEEAPTTTAVPVFTNDNDLAAFVRDLTIDDTIAHCFADLPSTGDDTLVSSIPTSMASRPEQKLISSGSKRDSSAPRERIASGIKRRSPASRHLSQPSPPRPSASHSARSKPRGFLASLLARGNKARRGGGGGSHRKPHRKGDKVTDADLQAEGQKLTLLTIDSSETSSEVAAETVARVRSQTRSDSMSTSDVGVEDLEDSLLAESPTLRKTGRNVGFEVTHGQVEVLPVIEESFGQVTIHTTTSVPSVNRVPSVSYPGNLLSHPFPHTLLGSTVVGSELSSPVMAKGCALKEHDAPKSYAGTDQISSDSGKKGRSVVTTQVLNSYESSPKRKDQNHWHPKTEKENERLPPSGQNQRSHSQLKKQRFSLRSAGSFVSDLNSPRTGAAAEEAPACTQKRFDMKKEPNSASVEQSSNSCVFSSGQFPIQGHENRVDASVLPTPYKAWEGLCDGIDYFIDFERDPDLEVPVDEHLSAHLRERRLSSNTQQEEGCEFATKQPVSSTSIALTSSVPSQSLTSDIHCSFNKDMRSAPQDSYAKMPGESAETSTKVTSYHKRAFMVSSLVTTSTQTEDQNISQSERAVKTKMRHCLQNAITQLSSLPACSSCERAISRTLSNLQTALSELKGMLTTHDDDYSCDITRATHNSVNSGKIKTASHPSRPDSGKGTTETDQTPDTSSPYTAASVDCEAADKAQVPSIPAAEEHTGVIAQNWKYARTAGPQHQQPAYGQHDTDTTFTCLSSSSRTSPEQLKDLSGHCVTEKSSSGTTPESDSDSTSTVTSEPTTVLLRQSRNRTSPRSQSVTQSSDVVDGLSEPPGEQIAPSMIIDKMTVVVEDVKQSDGPGHGPVLSKDSHIDHNEHSPVARSGKTPSESGGAAGSREPLPRTAQRNRQNSPRPQRYAGEADRDCESFMTSSWSEMTSVSSVSDTITSADESSYYSGDDDNDDEDDEDDGDDDDDEEDDTPMVRLGLLDEDRDDSELRHHRLQRHLASVLRQTTTPSATVETVVAATGERLNSQERLLASHINQGSMYPFRPRAQLTPPFISASPPLHVATMSDRGRGDSLQLSHGVESASVIPPKNREARAFSRAKKGGTTPRLFSPDRQVSLVTARQMTSEEFREGYDRSCDVTKLKRSQLDSDVPWDLIQCSDTDEDNGSEKAWYNVTSEEENIARVYGSDTDSSTTASDW